jgi:hypothetical protein
MHCHTATYEFGIYVPFSMSYICRWIVAYKKFLST